MAQTIIVILSIIIAIGYLLRHFWKMLFQKKSSCEGCGISKGGETKIQP